MLNYPVYTLYMIVIRRVRALWIIVSGFIPIRDLPPPRKPAQVPPSSFVCGQTFTYAIPIYTYIRYIKRFPCIP